jgi:hypothetical protein
MSQNRIGALLLLVATLAAIVWANVSLASYETFWETHRRDRLRHLLAVRANRLAPAGTLLPADPHLALDRVGMLLVMSGRGRDLLCGRYRC